MWPKPVSDRGCSGEYASGTNDISAGEHPASWTWLTNVVPHYAQVHEMVLTSIKTLLERVAPEPCLFTSSVHQLATYPGPLIGE
jgi:hypothetical protein